MLEAPVLRLAAKSKPYWVVTDASDFAVGAILMQEHEAKLHPVAYTSWKMRGAELNYPVHEKEMLAVIHAYKQWRCYLENRKSTVVTDHYALQYLKKQPTLNRRQARSMGFLESNFDYCTPLSTGQELQGVPGWVLEEGEGWPDCCAC